MAEPEPPSIPADDVEWLVLLIQTTLFNCGELDLAELREQLHFQLTGSDLDHLAERVGLLAITDRDLQLVIGLPLDDGGGLADDAA